MITGLVFGKFMPIHQGHLALIEFARRQCDRLIVSMTISPDDVLLPELRLRWLTELLAPYPTIDVVAEAPGFRDSALPTWEATKLWAAFIKRRFPTVSVFFSSAVQQANRVLFCDTDVITTQIYLRIYLPDVPPVLYELERQICYDAYVLLDIDLPWIADTLRDQGHRRPDMLARFQHELDRRKLPYHFISGSYSERLKRIRDIVDNLLDTG